MAKKIEKPKRFKNRIRIEEKDLLILILENRIRGMQRIDRILIESKKNLKGSKMKKGKIIKEL